MTFERSTEIASKKIDFLYSPLKDIPLGSVNIGNLQSSDLYNVRFVIKSNLKINPFKDISLNGATLLPKVESDGTISYVYEYTGMGNSITKKGNIIFTLNEYFNVNTNTIQLSVGDFQIQKISGTTPVSVYSENSSQQVNISYLYEFGNCFDGNKDYCSMSKLTSPYLLLTLAYGKNIPSIQKSETSDTSKSTTTSTNTSTTPGNNKKNADILVFSFKTQQFNTYNQKFKDLYVTLKTAKKLKTEKLLQAKSTINEIIRNLKTIDDNDSKRVVNSAKSKLKRNVAILLRILRTK